MRVLNMQLSTVTRIAFLSGPRPVAVDPRKEHDDDDDDDDDFETPRAPNREPHHTPQESGGTDSRPQPRTTPHTTGERRD